MILCALAWSGEAWGVHSVNYTYTAKNGDLNHISSDKTKITITDSQSNTGFVFSGSNLSFDGGNNTGSVNLNNSGNYSLTWSVPAGWHINVTSVSVLAGSWGLFGNARKEYIWIEGAQSSNIHDNTSNWFTNDNLSGKGDNASVSIQTSGGAAITRLYGIKIVYTLILDVSALESAIATAQSFYNGLKEYDKTSTDGVTLNTAISTAQAAINTVQSPTEVNNATTDINSALTEAKKKLPTLRLYPDNPVWDVSTNYKKVTLWRTLKEGFYTLALPFSTTIEALTGGRKIANDWVAQLQTVTHTQADAGTVDEYTLYFNKTAKGDDTDGGAISAGQPYVLHLGEDISGYPSWENQSVPAAVAETVTATSGYGSNVGANGTYASWSMTANFGSGMPMNGLYGIVHGAGGLKMGGSGSSLNAFTAYITGPTSGPNGAPRLRVAYVDEDGTATFIGSLPEDDLQGEPVAIYGPDGQRRSKMQRGVNIVRYADGTTKKVQL